MGKIRNNVRSGIVGDVGRLDEMDVWLVCVVVWGIVASE